MPDWSGDPLNSGAGNNNIVIYELPTRWTKREVVQQGAVGIGTFRDVLAQVDETVGSPSFPGIPEFGPGRAYLRELGINALELLPPADHSDSLGWGYGTANFFAPSFYLGLPLGQDAPTSTTDLARLIDACHQRGIRFFYDAVMAFSRDDAYSHVNFADFHVKYCDPSQQPGCTPDPEQRQRQAWGGDLFKYDYSVDSYDPLSGQQKAVFPARQLMKAHLAHWMNSFHVDGFRLDSVNNIDNYDFLAEANHNSREWWRQRGGTDDRFLVVGEELSLPKSLLQQNCVDALWNEQFKERVRYAITGQQAPGDADFETTIRNMIDCRQVTGREGGSVFVDGAQAINYITSHDVQGFRNERIYNLLAPVVFDTERRIKLAFVCLLTAVGIPMILAGEEFADEQDMDISQDTTTKQTDPVDYARLGDDWRQRLFQYVARLIRNRIDSAALGSNDTQFIHADFSEGKRVLAWQRGSGESPVVVVANFSDWGTSNPADPSAEYRIPNWPATPPGTSWAEITQGRAVPATWVGREPVYPWEAKVYVS
jgi:1,4-alpha-glucan branching enzyme